MLKQEDFNVKVTIDFDPEYMDDPDLLSNPLNTILACTKDTCFNLSLQNFYITGPGINMTYPKKQIKRIEILYS